MLRKISNLIEVRKIIALMTFALFIALSLMNVLEVNFVQTVIITVISFYFGKSTALDKPKE